MKFKNRKDEQGDYRELLVTDKDKDTVVVKVDGNRVYIVTDNVVGVDLTRAKALKFAQALLVELS